MFEHFRVPVAGEKLEGPTSRITFLGIKINVQEMVLRLPAEKLSELQHLVSTWITRKSCCKQELQSLVGKLQHACKVVHPGRTFLRRVLELMAVAAEKHHRIRLNAAIQSDLLLRHSFLVAWNGVSMIVVPQEREIRIEVFIDASGSIGCGAWWNPHCLQLKQ